MYHQDSLLLVLSNMCLLIPDAHLYTIIATKLKKNMYMIVNLKTLHTANSICFD